VARHAQFALKLRLRGGAARVGAVTVPDLLRVCGAAQELVNRQAEVLRGREARHPGPRSREIVETCTLELVGIGKGSTVLELGLAPRQGSLIVERDLGALAVREVGEVVGALASGGEVSDFDPGVIAGLRRLGGALDGIEGIDWIVPAWGGRKRLVAEFGRAVRDRLQVGRAAPAQRKLTVDGILEMADFKPEDRRCRIRPAAGGAVPCEFPPELAEAVYSMLRRRVRASGCAEVGPGAERVGELRLESLTGIEEERVGGASFFESKSFEQLAAEQEVEPLRDPRALAGGWPEGEDLDEFLAEIYAERRA
jgi:hypothetical protein